MLHRVICDLAVEVHAGGHAQLTAVSVSSPMFAGEKEFLAPGVGFWLLLRVRFFKNATQSTFRMPNVAWGLERYCHVPPSRDGKVKQISEGMDHCLS